MKKKFSFGSQQQARGRRWRTGGTTSFIVVILLVILMLPTIIRGPGRHDDQQQEAKSLLQVSTVSQAPKTQDPKVAFLFLARNHMPLDFLWEHFFQGSNSEHSVYIHARPGFVYTQGNTKCPSFVNRQLNNSILVEWGEATMIEAERLLLAEALKDPLNHRFILLSDSCIPLYNFRYIYNYVMESPKSFVDSFMNKNDPRYNHKMGPVIWKEQWRKGSQWFVLIRKHAAAVVEDSTAFPLFQRFCKRLALPEFWSEFAQARSKDEHNCIPDEHYLQTLLSIRNMEGEIERRSVTYSEWKNFQKGTMDRRGWHPITFDYSKATLEAIIDIQNITEIHYSTESRTEFCGVNGKARPCYLFARKFNRGAGIRLLEQSAAYENRIAPHQTANLDK